MSELIRLILILAIAAGSFWVIDQMGVPHPINWIAKLAVGLIALLLLLQMLGVAI